MVFDDSIQVRIDEVQSGRSTKVTKEPGLYVRAAQRLPEQRVFIQVDLTHREIIRRAPVSIDQIASRKFKCHEFCLSIRLLCRTWPNIAKSCPESAESPSCDPHAESSQT